MSKLNQIKIGDLGRVVTGKTPPTKSSKFWNGKYPFMTPKDISNDSYHVSTERFLSGEWKTKSPNYLLPVGTSCFVCIGATIGKICLVDSPSFSNQQINSVIADESKHNRQYVFYLLKTLENEVKSRAGGAATPIVNKSSFSDIDISVINKTEQDKVAEILSNYDNLIENNNCRIAILEDMAQSLYREWFVHFRFPGHEQCQFKDSELGRIPEGWEVKTLEKVASFQNGYAFKNKDYIPEDANTLTLFRMGNISKGGWINLSQKNVHVDMSDNEKHRKFILNRGDIAMCMTDMKSNMNLLGYSAYIDDDEKWVLNQRVGRIVANEEIIYKSFLFYYLNSDSYINYIRSTANSGVQVNLSTVEIRQSPILLPDNKVLNAWNSFARPILDEKLVFEKKNQILSKQRNMLLPKLISGKIEV